MRRLFPLVLLLALAALAGPASAGAAQCEGADVRPTADNLSLVAQSTLCLINAERAGAGLGALTEQAQLTKASTDFSALMVSEHFFAHVSPDGTELAERLTKAGYLGANGSWVVGENIAWGESYLASPAEIVKAWMNSPPHRANILNGDYEEIGLGIAIGTPSTPNPGATYTTDFGRRRTDDPPATTAKGEITVGDVAPAPQGAGRGSHRSSAPEPASRPAPRKAATRMGCGRHARRARASRHVARMRCVGAWLAVTKRL